MYNIYTIYVYTQYIYMFVYIMFFLCKRYRMYRRPFLQYDMHALHPQAQRSAVVCVCVCVCVCARARAYVCVSSGAAVCMTSA